MIKVNFLQSIHFDFEFLSLGLKLEAPLLHTIKCYTAYNTTSNVFEVSI